MASGIFTVHHVTFFPLLVGELWLASTIQLLSKGTFDGFPELGDHQTLPNSSCLSLRLISTIHIYTPIYVHKIRVIDLAMCFGHAAYTAQQSHVAISGDIIIHQFTSMRRSVIFGWFYPNHHLQRHHDKLVIIYPMRIIHCLNPIKSILFGWSNPHSEWSNDANSTCLSLFGRSTMVNLC